MHYVQGSKTLRKVKVCVSVVKCLAVSMRKIDMTAYLKQEEAEEKQRFCVEPRGCVANEPRLHSTFL